MRQTLCDGCVLGRLDVTRGRMRGLTCIIHLDILEDHLLLLDDMVAGGRAEDVLRSLGFVHRIAELRRVELLLGLLLLFGRELLVVRRDVLLPAGGGLLPQTLLLLDRRQTLGLALALLLLLLDLLMVREMLEILLVLVGVVGLRLGRVVVQLLVVDEKLGLLIVMVTEAADVVLREEGRPLGPASMNSFLVMRSSPFLSMARSTATNDLVGLLVVHLGGGRVLLGLGVVNAVDGLDLGTVENTVAVEIVERKGTAEVEGVDVVFGAHVSLDVALVLDVGGLETGDLGRLVGEGVVLVGSNTVEREGREEDETEDEPGDAHLLSSASGGDGG